MNDFMKILAVSAALTIAGGAHASTVVTTGGSTPSDANLIETANLPVNASVTTTETLGLGDTATFTYTALEDLKVNTISIAATGTKDGADLATLVFGFTNPPGTPLSSILTSGGSANGTAFLGGFTLFKDQSFSIYWDAVNAGPVGISASFSTAVIPVPAALPLLIGGIAALGVVGRKKRA